MTGSCSSGVCEFSKCAKSTKLSITKSKTLFSTCVKSMSLCLLALSPTNLSKSLLNK